MRVERRVVPVSADPERRLAVLERELWRIAVENLNYSEQHAWAALAGARVTSNNWRRAKAMIQHDQAKELRRRFLLTCLQRNRNHQLRLKALAEVAALREAEPFDDAVDVVATWPRDERRAGAKVLLQALAEKRIGRRDQAQAWVWRLAEMTRELHEEYAVQRWPETKRLLGSSSTPPDAPTAATPAGSCTPRASRTAASRSRCWLPRWPTHRRPRRFFAAPGCGMARKPSAVARELLAQLPQGRASAGGGAAASVTAPESNGRTREKLAPDKGEDKTEQADKDDEAIEAGRRGRSGLTSSASMHGVGRHHRAGQPLQSAGARRLTSPEPSATRSPAGSLDDEVATLVDARGDAGPGVDAGALPADLAPAAAHRARGKRLRPRARDSASVQRASAARAHRGRRRR